MTDGRLDEVVIDTSAVVAVLTGEASGDALVDTMEQAARRSMSAATLVEVGIVMEARYGPAGRLAVEQFLRDGAVEVTPLDSTGAGRALDGWRRFGKGRHAAALNLGDCFTYALAAERAAAVLCTGNDFGQTDVEVVPLRP